MTDKLDDQADSSGGIAIGDILAALTRRARLIGALAVAGGLVAVGVALYLPNQYEAVATVQIDPRKKTIVSLDAVLPDIAGDTPTIESQVEILRSRVIALKVIDALGLRHDSEFYGTPKGETTAADPALAAAKENVAAAARRMVETAESVRRVSGPEPSAIGADKPERDAVAAAFSARLRTMRVRNSLIVEISFKSRDPVKAARIANTIAEVYIRDQIDMKIKATGLAAELVGPKLDGLRRKVADAEHKIATFKAVNGIFDAEGQLLSEKKLARLMEQTVAARNATADARAKFDQLQTMLRGGEGRHTGDVLMSQTIRMLKDQLATATKREAELLTKYGPKHPEIAKVRAEVADVRSQISRETDQILANVKQDYEVAVERERMLEVGLGELKAQQSVSKGVTVELRDLEREAETSRRVFEAFLARYKQMVETQDLHLPDARIVEKADVPFLTVAPKRKQIVLIGFIGSLGLGIALALAMEFSRVGLTRRDEIEAMLGVPMLAAVPLLKRQSDGLSNPLAGLRIVLSQPRGGFARAIGKITDALERQRTDSAPRIIMVTSSLPNEGTTVTASNMALSTAQRGLRTLLIDADFRRSKLTQHLGLEDSQGLVDAIGHGQDFETVILKDTTSGVAVIPAGNNGRFPLAPQEMLGAPGFGQRLARLKNHFDVIILDAPPIMPVVDARILASYVDQVVLVVAWQRTSKDIIRRAVQALGSNATLLSGVVLNQVDLASSTASRGGPLVRTEPQRLGGSDRRAA
jgi:capsular exopolysaccharide synthesis family protein